MRIKAFNRHLLYVNATKVLLIKILDITRRVFKCNKNRSFIPNSRVRARIHVRPSRESLAARERGSVRESPTAEIWKYVEDAVRAQK